MGVRTTLESTRDDLLRRIHTAAGGGGDAAAVVELSRDLQRVEAALRQLDGIEATIRSLENERARAGSTPPINRSRAPRATRPTKRPEGAKAAGEQRRHDFVERARRDGIALEPLGRVLYRSQAGKVVAIASASERAANRWFLGLPDETFDIAVLLCEDATGVIHSFVLDDSAFSVYGESLSRDDRGQIKFNVTRKNGRFFLRVPHRGTVELFEDDVRALSADD